MSETGNKTPKKEKSSKILEESPDKNQIYYDVTEKEYEDNLSKSRKFCRNVEKNLNNYIQNETSYDHSKPSSTFYISIESINGIKKEQKVIILNRIYNILGY